MPIVESGGLWSTEGEICGREEGGRTMAIVGEAWLAVGW